MTASLDLLTAVGTAVASSLGTDLYEYVRTRFGELMRKQGAIPEQDETPLSQLDALNQLILTTPSAERGKFTTELQVPIIRILDSYLPSIDPTLLGELIEEINRRKQSASQQHIPSHQTVSNNTAGGGIVVAGRDNNIGGNR